MLVAARLERQRERRALTRVPSLLLDAASLHEVVEARAVVPMKIMPGKPPIPGTRIPVEAIVRKISEGLSERDVLDAYPGLKPEDIRAALAYAADTLAHEETILIDPPKKAAS